MTEPKGLDVVWIVSRRVFQTGRGWERELVAAFDDYDDADLYVQTESAKPCKSYEIVEYVLTPLGRR